MAQCASLFSQILALFNRGDFAGIVRKHQAERHAKGFTCWNQFVAMLFCQLAQAHSLREICGGLACCLGKLIHLGMRQAPNKPALTKVGVDLKLCQRTPSLGSLSRPVLSTLRALPASRSRKETAFSLQE